MCVSARLWSHTLDDMVLLCMVCGRYFYAHAMSVLYLSSPVFMCDWSTPKFQYVGSRQACLFACCLGLCVALISPSSTFVARVLFAPLLCLSVGVPVLFVGPRTVVVVVVVVVIVVRMNGVAVRSCWTKNMRRTCDVSCSVDEIGAFLSSTKQWLLISVSHWAWCCTQLILLCALVRSCRNDEWICVPEAAPN